MKINEIKVGVLGGGQLGQMLIAAANDYGLNLHILDPNKEATCSRLTSNFTQGDFLDFDAVYQFGKSLDVITIEIEKVNVDALKKLREEGVKVIPSPEVIETIQDKGLQKQFFVDHNINTAKFEYVDDIKSYEGSFPFVQKIRRGGYDGHGVKVIKSKEDLENAIEGKSIVEDLVPIKKELAIIVARNKDGEVVTYDPVEMHMDPELHLVDYLLCPSTCSSEQIETSKELASKIANSFKLEGIMAIELFVSEEGEILVNELSPRPHNSGHHTIEACYTSQYKQLLAAILDIPFGSTNLRAPAVMINILGESGYSGVASYENLASCSEQGVYVHLYGKHETRPNRKMGHITIVSDNIESSISKAKMVRSQLKVQA